MCSGMTRRSGDRTPAPHFLLLRRSGGNAIRTTNADDDGENETLYGRSVAPSLLVTWSACEARSRVHSSRVRACSFCRTASGDPEGGSRRSTGTRFYSLEHSSHSPGRHDDDNDDDVGVNVMRASATA